MSGTPQRLLLSSGEMPLILTRRDRARRFILRLDDAGDAVTLTVPRHASIKAALQFLEENRHWLERRLADLPPRVPFAEGSTIPLLGAPHVIRHRPDSRGEGVAWIEGRALNVAGETRFLARRVRDFLKERARREAGARARAMAQAIGRKVARVAIRDTRSRWASCAQSGDLAFSWRLVLAPAEVLDYVVAHEVAHLRHMNHGPKFWKLVGELAPDYEGPRLWLRRNRLFLLRFG
jgi:predicted metal-dependent hydrolase